VEIKLPREKKARSRRQLNSKNRAGLVGSKNWYQHRSQVFKAFQGKPEKKKLEGQPERTQKDLKVMKNGKKNPQKNRDRRVGKERPTQNKNQEIKRRFPTVKLETFEWRKIASWAKKKEKFNTKNGGKKQTGRSHGPSGQKWTAGNHQGWHRTFSSDCKKKKGTGGGVRKDHGKQRGTGWREPSSERLGRGPLARFLTRRKDTWVRKKNLW